MADKIWYGAMSARLGNSEVRIMLKCQDSSGKIFIDRADIPIDQLNHFLDILEVARLRVQVGGTDAARMKAHQYATQNGVDYIIEWNQGDGTIPPYPSGHKRWWEKKQHKFSYV